MKISVIVPTYNRPQALRLCLASLAKQSTLPSEVLIADDGSTSETSDAVQEMQSLFKEFFPLVHVWQENDGFRKPKILNETVRQSTGEYLIFIDGDCMAHRHFVRAHIEQSNPEAILGGKRVEIGKQLTELLLRNKKVLNSLNLRLIVDSAMLRSRKVEESIQIKNKRIRKWLHRDKIHNDGIWGCNFSIYRNLFYEINGCDEDFLDGSFEDTDLGIRALNQGKQVKSVRGLAIIFHLWHPSTWSVDNEKYKHNALIARKRIENKEPLCKHGIRKFD